jgi:hypothetical protein
MLKKQDLQANAPIPKYVTDVGINAAVSDEQSE